MNQHGSPNASRQAVTSAPVSTSAVSSSAATQAFPLQLHDRVLSAGEDDLEVLRTVDDAVRATEGLPPASVPRPPEAVSEAIRTYQQRRGLVVDGVVAPKRDAQLAHDRDPLRSDGPTAQQINADLYERKLAGRGHRPADPQTVLPLAAGVGAGEANRAEDVAKLARALALLGHVAKEKVLAAPGANSGAGAESGKDAGVGPEAEPKVDPEIDAGIRDFQRAHGLMRDGRVLPGGPTQARMATPIEAKVAAETGTEPAQGDGSAPSDFVPVPPAPVVRTSPASPTGRRVPTGTGMTPDTDDRDHRLAREQHAVMKVAYDEARAADAADTTAVKDTTTAASEEAGGTLEEEFPRPDYRVDKGAAPEFRVKKAEWKRVLSAVSNRIPSRRDRDALSQVLSAEGGFRPDGNSYSGITPGALAGLLEDPHYAKELARAGIDKGAIPTKLSDDQVIAVYQTYLTDVIAPAKAKGKDGLSLLSGTVPDARVLAPIIDTLVRMGGRGGTKVIQGAVNDTRAILAAPDNEITPRPPSIEADGVFGSGTLRAIEGVAASEASRKVFVNRMMDRRDETYADKPHARGEIARNRSYRID